MKNIDADDKIVSKLSRCYRVASQYYIKSGNITKAAESINKALLSKEELPNIFQAAICYLHALDESKVLKFVEMTISHEDSTAAM